MEHLLDVRDLNSTYLNKSRNVQAVRHANFTIDKGDSLGLVGESGSGKSTMAMGMLRILPQDSIQMTGSALFMGKDLVTISDEEMNKLRWKEIAVVFQKAMNSLSPVHRIGMQIEDIYHVHEPKATKKEIHDRTMELLKLVNMPERVYKLYPHEMSGGMLQRVAIVISLLHSPKLLVFDEATTALDVVTQGQILEEVVQIHVHHARHVRRRFFLHEGRGLVRRRAGGDWSGARCTEKPAASLYAGFDEFVPVADGREEAAARHSGLPSGSLRSAEGMRIRFPLPALHRSVHGAEAHSAGYARRTQGGLSSGGRE